MALQLHVNLHVIQSNCSQMQLLCAWALQLSVRDVFKAA
jgi:hypothetical protein